MRKTGPKYFEGEKSWWVTRGGFGIGAVTFHFSLDGFSCKQDMYICNGSSGNNDSNNSSDINNTGDNGQTTDTFLNETG